MAEPPPTPNRPEPDARGDLGRTPFAHLLVYVSERKLSGSIEFAQADGRTSAIGLTAGEVKKARTSEPVAPLGQLLLDMGHVTQEVLDATRATLTEKGGLHGQILRDAGVSAGQLREALQAQLALKLDYVFTLPPQTTFAFYNAFDVLEGYGGDERLSFDLLSTIWRGVCISPPREHVEAAIKRVEGAPLRLKPAESIEHLAIADDFVRLITLMRQRPVMLDELLHKGGLNPETARLVLYTLLITKNVEPVEAITVAVPMPQLPSAAALALSAAQKRTQEMLNPRAGKPAVAVAAAPSSSSMRAASPADLTARRAEILDLAGRIERMDYFEMLGVAHDATPAQIEATFLELAKRWHPDKLPAAIADLREPTTRVFGRFTEAHKTLMKPEDRTRYMTLIKDGGATPEAQAYISRIVEAATTFQKAEVCAKRGDYAQAGLLCRKAHHDDPTQADYLALLAWIESMDAGSQSPEATRQKIAMLDRAVAVSPRSERGYYYRGMLYKKIGQTELAMADFRKVTELNPRNTEAGREVHLYESRKAAGEPTSRKAEPAPGSKISGLFSKLLKK